MTSTAVLVEDVHVRFGDVHALAGVDLDVPSGTTLGVLLWTIVAALPTRR